MAPLHGRDDDLARIRSLLDSGQVRLLTLVGPGGVGKTRLSESVVAAIAKDYADGVVTISLAPLQDAGEVLQAASRHCDAPIEGDASSVNSLAATLLVRHLLPLLLDNFEHVLDPAPSCLDKLLAACPRLTILVTSRVPLRLKDEYRYPVAPLAVPEPSEAGDTPSERLFIDRARAVQPDFAPDPIARDSIAVICRYLDGLPLAIELAAARTSALSPVELRARLGGTSGEDTAVRDAHASWYLDHVNAASEGLDTLGRVLAIDALESDHPNHQAALDWLARSGQGERLLQMVLVLQPCWFFGGHESEGQGWYRRALTLVPDETSGDRLEVRLAMAELAHAINDPGTDDLIAQASSLAIRAGTTAQRAEAALHCAMRAEGLGDFAAAEVAFLEALSLFDNANPPWYVLVCNYHLGVVAFGQGDLATARERLEAARVAGTAQGSPFVPLWALINLLLIACENGDEANATALSREHPAPDHVGYRHTRMPIRIAAGALASLRNDHEAAVRLFTATEGSKYVYEPEASIVNRGIECARHSLALERFAAARERGLRLSPREIDAEVARLEAGSGPALVELHAEPGTDDHLSPREREVLVLLAQGKMNQEIAEALFISPRTAVNHVSNILAKLDLGARIAAVAYAIRHHLDCPSRVDRHAHRDWVWSTMGGRFHGRVGGHDVA